MVYHMNFFKKKIPSYKGFTLVEVLVAVSIFALVMIVATGAVFSVVSANKKTHSLKSVMTNLNFALDSMVRDIRVGSTYSCDLSDCTDGGTVFTFKANRDVDGNGQVNDNVEYSLDSGRIMKRIYGLGVTSESDSPITAAEITVEYLVFYVYGALGGDGKQAKVTISIRGHAGVGETRSDFNIQTTVSQRSIDS